MLTPRGQCLDSANEVQEETKNSLKKKRKSRHSDPARIEDLENEAPEKTAKAKKKRVSFG